VFIHICVYLCASVAKVMPEPIIIDLIRHGEVAGRKHVARGRTDNPLSDAGWQQFQPQMHTDIS